MKEIQISVCIPVYNTEKYLERCLQSVAEQNFESLEIVLVDDCSPGQTEEGLNCKKIVKNFSRKNKIPVNYIRNSNNLGILETRRIAIINAKGKYVFFVDSDDVLFENSLSTLYQTAISEDADIVQGNVENYNLKNNQFVPSNIKKCTAIYIGELLDHDIFTKTFIEEKTSSIICAKLYKREVLITAFESIPFVYCNLAESYLFFFFIVLNSHKFIGINTPVYKYIINTGLTSGKKIDTLDKCKSICSSASVFTVIFDFLEKNNHTIKLNEEEITKIGEKLLILAKQSIDQVEKNIIPELKEQAQEILLNYWGENIITVVKNKLNQNNK